MNNKKKLTFIAISLIVVLSLLGGYLYHLNARRTSSELLFEKFRFQKISSFVDGLYDKDRNGFKIDNNSPVSIKADAYATVIKQTFLRENIRETANLEAMFDRIRTY